MITRIFLYITGFSLSVAGGITTIAYLNLLTTGHTFKEYVIYISTRFECLLLPFGIFLIWVSIFFPKLTKD